MIANYGYRDGSGEYYIAIDTDQCVSCAARACLNACPQRLFETLLDDDDEEVVCIREDSRRKLAYACAACKPSAGHVSLPCVDACVAGAIAHSW